MKILITGLLVLSLLPVLSAAGEVAWRSWHEAQFERAAAEDKLVLLDLSAGWCAFCKRMDATTWRDPRVVALVEKHYLPVRILDEQDPLLAERYRDHGRPAIVIYDANGRELLRKRGYLKPQWMAWLLEALLLEQRAGGEAP